MILIVILYLNFLFSYQTEYSFSCKPWVKWLQNIEINSITKYKMKILDRMLITLVFTILFLWLVIMLALVYEKNTKHLSSLNLNSVSDSLQRDENDIEESENYEKSFNETELNSSRSKEVQYVKETESDTSRSKELQYVTETESSSPSFEEIQYVTETESSSPNFEEIQYANKTESSSCKSKSLLLIKR